MLCRSDQYLMTSKELQPGSIRVRLAVLGSFGKWAVRHGRFKKNITLPAKRSRIPGVPRWEAVEQFLARCSRQRDKAMVALMVYGGLRRAEVVRFNVGDYQPQFGLRRVLGKGGHETTVPLPEVCSRDRQRIPGEGAARRGGQRATVSDPVQVVRR